MYTFPIYLASRKDSLLLCPTPRFLIDPEENGALQRAGLKEAEALPHRGALALAGMEKMGTVDAIQMNFINHCGDDILLWTK